MENDKNTERIEKLELQVSQLTQLLKLQAVSLKALNDRMEIARSTIEGLQQAELARSGGRKRPDRN
jgi:hypothetical protein